MKRDTTVKTEVPEDPGRMMMTWSELVERIHAGDSAGMEELYRLFSRGIRYFLCRQLGSHDIDDKIHDVFVVITQAIQRGDLREPDRLMGYVRTVVRRQIAAHIESAMYTRRNVSDIDSGTAIPDEAADPEQAAMRLQNKELVEQLLSSISPRDREILTRFYLREEPQQHICREMKLTETQFRLIKSRAKARFGELGRQALSRRTLSQW
jgi:RNA polymerase sigma-70 factor (ECF subfamily)